jgi:subtilisin family serine protease
VARIGSESLHATGVRGTGIKVAVLDTGIAYAHPDLAANYAGGRDFVNNDNDPNDDNNHGSHVAGTIAAVLNGTGVVGVAPEARLYGVKVLNASGSGSWSGIIAGVQWVVDNGIKITNNSYGSSSNPGSIVEAAYANSAAAGVLHIASAGNSGTCAGNTDTVGYPAKFASVVAVAATQPNDARPCFSRRPASASFPPFATASIRRSAARRWRRRTRPDWRRSSGVRPERRRRLRSGRSCRAPRSTSAMPGATRFTASDSSTPWPPWRP